MTDDFVHRFGQLPEVVREQARSAYQRWKADPWHPGLRFKPIRSHPGLYSVRIGSGWRALGRLVENTMTWFWIGSHADYDGEIA